MFPRLLIDGYNLLHATGALKGALGAAGQLGKARERLLRQLAQGLSEEERLATQIVFDAQRSVKGDDQHVVRGMTVTYAVGFDEADDLLEQIIRQHPQPRSLTVVSSDLRVQRTAKSRKAVVFTSDQWLMQLMDRTGQAESPTDRETETLTGDPTDQTREPLSPDEVAKWLKEFGFPP